MAKLGADFVVEARPIDGIATRAIAIWVPCLDHEVLNDPLRRVGV